MLGAATEPPAASATSPPSPSPLSVRVSNRHVLFKGSTKGQQGAAGSYLSGAVDLADAAAERHGRSWTMHLELVSAEGMDENDARLHPNYLSSRVPGSRTSLSLDDYRLTLTGAFGSQDVTLENWAATEQDDGTRHLPVRGAVDIQDNTASLLLDKLYLKVRIPEQDGPSNAARELTVRKMLAKKISAAQLSSVDATALAVHFTRKPPINMVFLKASLHVEGCPDGAVEAVSSTPILNNNAASTNRLHVLSLHPARICVRGVTRLVAVTEKSHQLGEALITAQIAKQEGTTDCQTLLPQWLSAKCSGGNHLEIDIPDLRPLSLQPTVEGERKYSLKLLRAATGCVAQTAIVVNDCWRMQTATLAAAGLAHLVEKCGCLCEASGGEPLLAPSAPAPDLLHDSPVAAAGQLPLLSSPHGASSSGIGSSGQSAINSVRNSLRGSPIPPPSSSPSPCGGWVDPSATMPPPPQNVQIMNAEDFPPLNVDLVQEVLADIEAAPLQSGAMSIPSSSSSSYERVNAGLEGFFQSGVRRELHEVEMMALPWVSPPAANPPRLGSNDAMDVDVAPLQDVLCYRKEEKEDVEAREASAKRRRSTKRRKSSVVEAPAAITDHPDVRIDGCGGSEEEEEEEEYEGRDVERRVVKGMTSLSIDDGSTNAVNISSEGPTSNESEKRQSKKKPSKSCILF